MITTENLLQYFKTVYQLKKDHPYLRLGQCHVNVFEEMFPYIDRKLFVGTNYDCFYNDDRIDEFIIFITEQIDKQNETNNSHSA